MKSECDGKGGTIDLPSLMAIKGDEWNFSYMGSVVLQSDYEKSDRCRCFGAVDRGNSIGFGLFPMYDVSRIYWYMSLILLTSWCLCS